MTLTDILLVAFGAALSLIGGLILYHLRVVNRRLDRSEDRAREDRKAADDRAREDRKAADDRAKEYFKAADDRAKEYFKAADDRAREDRKAADDRAREDRKAADDHFKAADDRAREDREVNRAEHARLFSAVDHVLDKVSGVEREVSDLKADVKVLRDRSDRSDRSKSSAGPTG